MNSPESNPTPSLTEIEHNVDHLLQVAKAEGQHDFRVAEFGGTYFPVCDTHNYSVKVGFTTRLAAKQALLRHFQNPAQLSKSRQAASDQ